MLFVQTNMKKQKNGFTLFELLVTISIIGILIALISISFSEAQKKARDARRMEDIKTVSTAAEQFYALSVGYTYPTSTATPWLSGSGSTILQNFPRDPKSGLLYDYSIAGGAYCVCATMENNMNGNSTNTACAFTGGTGPVFCARGQQ